MVTKQGLNKQGIIALLMAAIFSSVTLCSGYAWAAKETTYGAEEQHTALKGWSAKKVLLGKAVYNNSNQKIGDIDDIFVTTDKYVTYMIIGVGGFLGLGEHRVAIPAKDIKIRDGKLYFPNGTKQELKRMPKFEYKEYK